MQNCPSEIKDNLYLGSARALQDKIALAQLGITHIINAAIELPNEWDSDFAYLRLNLDDDPEEDILASLDSCCTFINECRSGKGKVLVHCQVGISRSATIVIAYLVMVEDMSFRDAFLHVKSRRCQIGPNRGFLRQLAHLEVSLGRKATFSAQSYYVECLTDMGFSIESAQRAVELCDGRMELAISMLLSRQIN